MTSAPKEASTSDIRAALVAARQNENRWLAMSPEFSADTQSMEQWASTAKLRRREVERLECILAGVELQRTRDRINGADIPAEVRGLRAEKPR